ncbi:MAG: dTMP kinase [Burkholderiales bacterium]|nr:dTMP kinase [Burkholderiales bacterium]MDE2290011.1 dTMP kinase [Burkholderiales bacterium]
MTLANPPGSRGKFITFEGIDGAGKSTHLAWFAEQLGQRLAHYGRQVICTREPGGTPLGERLRTLLLEEPMHLETEALLMFAARREHLARVISPALARGDWVISDRFTDATFAYQGGGRGLSIDKLTVLEQWVQEGLQPDLTVLFDLAPEVAATRLAGARAPDKFEREPAEFFARTRAEYLRRAAQAPQRFAVIDADQSREKIKEILEKYLASL